jgi:hypothetical protein
LDRTADQMQRMFQAAGWLLALAIIVLSLVPPSYRPTTGTSQGFEHVTIFLATGAASGLGHPNRSVLLAAALVAFSAAIEIAQFWAPGRHARMSDFLFDAAAACVGIGLAWMLSKLKAAAVGR